MKFPEHLKYTKEHEWLLSKNGKTLIGITNFAVEQLGDIVHVDLPKVGMSFKAGDAFGTIESTKTVSDLYMPVSGKVVAINESVRSAPESLQQDCYEKGWLVQLESTSAQEVGLMTAKEYEKQLS